VGHHVVARLTTDRKDPGLGYGSNDEPVPQNEAYLVMPWVLNDAVGEPYPGKKAERVRPFRASYRHVECGGVTTMSSPIAETYAINPKFYGATYCVGCHKHRPVGEFTWTADGEVVGS
jgi:hypothetical protein